MRLLMIEGAIRDNGGLRMVLSLAERWQQSGEEVTYFVLQKVADETSLKWRVPRTYGQRRSGRLRWSIPLLTVRLLRAARRADILVSVSETGTGLIAGAIAAKLLRRPLVVIVQAPIDETIPKWLPGRLQGPAFAIHRRVSAAICVSEGLRQSVIGNGLAPSRAYAIVNGIDVDAVNERAGERVPRRTTSSRIVSIGRLSREKGIDLLITAHGDLCRRGVRNELIIVGDGPERHSLEQLAISQGVEESVTFMGFQSNPYPLLASADVFCLSSRYEGFPLVLLEALALGIPVVSVNCRYGPSELLKDGLYGVLVEPESVPALRDALERVLSDPDLLRSLSAAGPGRARQYDPASIANEYLDVFREIRRRPAAGIHP